MLDDLYYLCFATCNGIGPVKLSVLFSYFHSLKDAWEADEHVLRASGVGDAAVEAIGRHRRMFCPEKYTELLEKKHIFFLPMTSFPHLLAAIPRTPIGLFGKGNKTLLLHEKKIGVVGTRTMTQYGHHVTDLFASELAMAGCCIVSGLAMGVDAAAHAAALHTNGATIAVLGSGVDMCTPRENERLYNEILSNNGLILSELPPGHKPHKGSFPSRNRIIAGLSQAVLVPEGAVDSGSLITAGFAFTFGRRVYTIPGPITSSVSQGPLSLVKKGAQFVSSPDDMLRDLCLSIGNTQKQKLQFSDPVMQQIIELLEKQNMYPDEIIKQTGIPPQKISSIVSIMEINGWIIHLPNGEIARR